MVMIMLINYFVTAFLRYNNSFLLQKRSEEAKIAPGMWYGVGGHIESNEFQTPNVAILREIYEETGLDSNVIDSINLKYVALNYEDSIYINYIYFGSIKTNKVIANDEGDLTFVEIEEIKLKKFHPLISACLEHGINDNSNAIYTAILDVNGNTKFVEIRGEIDER
ncbi:NUDIX domain-containing protein [Soehngenia longivitae]|uniref:NUDIX domain-containing protein n=2 Tax=Soehngenia longivitae TaxID=2562294 RepID=A0A4Z0D8D6_9FIRM|nr:NUDIX domain-containing protein [Soehngenia longivitae]